MVDVIISDKGDLVPVPIPLSIDIPETWNGTTVDPCSIDINSPGCTYILALQALSSQLVSYQPYSIAGVTFEPPNGTMGLPYYAMKHFSDEVKSIPFEDARRRYCLPVLDPRVVKCEEVGSRTMVVCWKSLTSPILFVGLDQWYAALKQWPVFGGRR